MGKKNKNKAGMIAVVAVVAILAVVAIAFVKPASISGEKLDDGTTFECTSETTPDLLVKAYNADKPGTALTEATNLYRKKGDTAWSTFTMGTAIADLEAGETYEFVPGITTSDQTDNAYGAPFEYTIACKSDDSTEVKMYNDEIETSVSAGFRNADKNAAAETFTAGQEKHVFLKLSAGADEYFGNPTLDRPNVLVLKLNSTAWDKPNEVSIDGVEMKQVSLPTLANANAASTHILYAYELPAISEDEIFVDIYLNADDTAAPSHDETAYIYAGGLYIDEDSNVASGVEDEENAAVAADAADSVTLDFT